MGEIIAVVEQVIVDSPTMPVYRAVLAMGCAVDGQLEQAQSVLDEDRAGGFQMPCDSGWSSAYAGWIEATVRLHDADAAKVLHSRLTPFHDVIVTSSVTVNCAFSHYLAMLDHLLGRFDDADRRFGEAMVMHERLGSPLLVAYTKAAWAAVLADRNAGDDHERARLMVEGALAAATAGGYGSVRADAAEVLTHVG